MAMNPDIKRRWVEALRSGKYKQGQGSLHKNVGGESHYCCLGVLCEIAVEDGVIEEAVLREDAYRYEYDNCASFPPWPVVQWAGIDSDDCDPYVNADEYGIEKGQSPTLSMLNDDDRNHSFAAIADLIENDKNL